MNKSIVLFIVEHKDRELDVYKKISKLLLTHGINSIIISRGYSAHIIPFLTPKVIISNRFIESSICAKLSMDIFFNKSNFIVHFWEQYSNAVIEAAYSKEIGDHRAKEFTTLYWHDGFKELLARDNFNMSKSHYVGNPNTVLLEEVNDKKEELDRKIRGEFGLKNKKILFFPSSFLPAFLEEGSGVSFHRIRDSFRAQLNNTAYFLKECLKDGKFVVIFRPHPYEVKKDYIDYFNDDIFKHPNFIYTNKYTAKDWTVISNCIVSNYSTVAVDAVSLGKSAFFLKVDGYSDVYNSTWFDKVPSIFSYSDLLNYNKEFTKSKSLENVDFYKEFTEIIKSSIDLSYPPVLLKDRFIGLFHKDLWKAVYRNILCKYFKCHGVSEHVRQDYFKPIIVNNRNM
jgi:hypothetical protein